MEGRFLVRDIHGLEFQLDADFIYEHSHIYTIDHKTFLKLFPQPDREPFIIDDKEITLPELRPNEFGYLVIDSIVVLDKFDSVTEGSAIIRPSRLVIYGIIAFLTGKVLMPFHVFASRSEPYNGNHLVQEWQPLLTDDENDYSDDLSSILSSIQSYDQNKKILLFSLFERWRKALHLEQESEESYTHLDEAVLSYVHILEVLADEYSDNLKKQIKATNDNCINQIQDLLGKHSKQKERKEIKLLVNKVKENQVTLKGKMLAMLNDFEIDNDKSIAIVNRFIEHRNAIAHGRPDIYQEKVVFPLKPFFSLIKDINENIDSIKYLAAKCLSSYLKVNIWSGHFEATLQLELTPLNTVRKFIASKEFEKMSPEDFINNHVEGPIPFDFSAYYLHGDLSFIEVEEALSRCLNSVRFNKRNYQCLFPVAVIISDSSNIILAEKARKIIDTVHKRRWGHYSNKRDILKAYEYYGKKLVWYREWLSSF